MARVLITIPDKLLKKIDRKAKARYSTRSGYIRKLIVKDVKYDLMNWDIFSDEFLRSLERAEKDYVANRYRKIRSLKQL